MTMNLNKDSLDGKVLEDIKLQPSQSTIEKFTHGKFFWFYHQHPRSTQRLKQLEPHFDMACLKGIVLPLICMKSKISLRLLNWFVISYCREHNILLTCKSTTTTPRLCVKTPQRLHVYNLYRTTLKYWKRELFDAFRRGPRIYFHVDKKLYSTTVAQLNYIHWAIKYHILDIIYDQWSLIHRKMTKAKAKKRQLQLNSVAACAAPPMIFQDPVTIQL